MRVRLSCLLLLLLALLPASQARSQCAEWHPGPLDTSTVNGVNGIVLALYPWDQSGGGFGVPWLIAAGQFTSIQGVAVNNIAVRNPGTGLWQPLGSGTDGAVYCITVYNNEVIAGGQFTQAGGVSVHNVARWNGSAWQALGNGVNPDGVNGLVGALTVYGGKVVAGGNFTFDGGNAHALSHVATWDPGSFWQSLGPGVNCGINPCQGQVAGSVVTAFAQWNGELIIGGQFGYAGQVVMHGLTRWNGSSYLSLGGHPNGRILGLQPYNGALVICGDFLNVELDGGGGFLAMNHITRWSGSTFASLGTGIEGTNASSQCMTVFQSRLIVSGNFGQAGGVAANHIASWNGTSWGALGSGLDSGAMCLTVTGSELVAGGGFTLAGGQPANALARWNGYQWAAFGGGTANGVFALTNFFGRVTAAGDFHQTTSDGGTAHDIVAWSGSGLSAFGTGMNGTVLALKSFKYPGPLGDYELIAAGLFTNAGGVASNFIARWDQDPILAFPPPAWAAMGGGFNSGVYAVERHNSVTYAGGAFTFSVITAVNRIARWNETSDVWEPMGTGMNGAVRALRSYGGYLYAGGSFTTAGGVSTGGLARWDGTSWSQVGGFFNGQVFSLEIYNGLLVIGGVYPGINSSPNLAYYNGSSYGTFATGGTNGTVRSICANGSRMYIGGDFSTAGGISASRIAYWDGSWHEVQGGTNDIVFALSSFNGEVQTGGYFSAVSGGGLVSPRWAAFSETGLPWFLVQPFSQSHALGDLVTFTAEPAAGYPVLGYQWTRNGVPVIDGLTQYGSTISGGTTTSLQIANVAWADHGDYQLRVTNDCGTALSVIATLTLTGVTGVGPPGAPKVTAFERAGPNPTGGTTQLQFSLAQGSQADFRIYDLAGRLVREIDLGNLSAGDHATTWNACDNRGQRIAAGTYFVSFDVDGRRIGNKRLTVLR